MDQVLVGFSIIEVAHDGYGFIQFEKADTTFVGVFQYLKRETARVLQAAGCRFINYEQDLGIAGIRKAKLSYHPVYMLKKFAVSYISRK